MFRHAPVVSWFIQRRKRCYQRKSRELIWQRVKNVLAAEIGQCTKKNQDIGIAQHAGQPLSIDSNAVEKCAIGPNIHVSSNRHSPNNLKNWDFDMSFWDKAFKVAKNVGTSVAAEIEASANEIREIKLKYESMGDDELLRVVHSDGFFGKTQKEKSIAFGILKKRGFDPEEIKLRKT